MPSFAPLTQDSLGDLENAIAKGKKIVIRKKGKILYEDIITYIENPETERLGLFRAFGKATGYSTNIQKVLPFLDTNNNLLGKM